MYFYAAHAESRILQLEGSGGRGVGRTDSSETPDLNFQDFRNPAAANNWAIKAASWQQPSKPATRWQPGKTRRKEEGGRRNEEGGKRNKGGRTRRKEEARKEDGGVGRSG